MNGQRREACDGRENRTTARSHQPLKIEQLPQVATEAELTFPSFFQFVGMFSPNRAKLSFNLPQRVYVAEIQKPLR
jgi:hypothetical protein